MSARSPRGRRLIAVVLYAGCVGATALVVKTVFSADSASTPGTPNHSRPPTDLDPFPLPPGSWTVLSAGRLDALARQVRGEAVAPATPADCPLLPPGIDPLAERVNAAGRVSAFVTAAEDRNVFVRHWTAGGWSVTEAGDPDDTPRPLALVRGSERALAWMIPAAGQPGRVQLLVTVAAPAPQTETRP